MEEKERYEIHIYDDICVDLYDNGVLDKSINDTYKLEELLNQQDKLIKELKGKMLILWKIKEEKDELLKQKIGDMKLTDFIRMCVDCGFMVQAKENDNQTAIRELEKVKGFLLEKIEEKQSCFDSGNYNDFADGVKTICELMLISIDNQIKLLKGENK